MKRMYFGNREYMTWIPCPAIDADLSTVGWGASGRYLNGGGYVRRSATSGKAYKFSWNLTEGENIYSVIDFYLGNYGQGPYYFLDPFAQGSNVLPSYWAAPRLAYFDAPPLVKEKRPSLVDTAPNPLGYPTKTAVYTLNADDEFAELWVPVPPDHTFHLGVHGSATGSAHVSVTPDEGSPAEVAMLPVATTIRTNHAINNTTGVTLSLGGTGQLSLSGLIAQVLPNGELPAQGDFISGRGHSGCEFEGAPGVVGYSAALDLQGATAALTEVGAWL